MRIAIPSYKRHKYLGDKTLKTLHNFGYGIEDIDIFVGNDEEYKLYKSEYPEYNIIVGEVGMREIREFIFNYYDEGTHVLSLDDDIIDVKMKNPNESEKSCLVKLENLKEIVDRGFEECVKNNTILWGIYPCDNHGFMKNNITTHLAFCVGWMWGCIIDKECLKLNISQYEDYERSIRVFKKYGKVIRLNNICAKTKYNNNTGGMCDDNRINIMKRDLEILKKLYNEYIIIKNKKSSILGVNPQIKSNIKNIL
tara:strand:+ start:336 stop:1094 length:759 start_codon:yes stop_codon:yes gene_type:complete